MANGRSPKRCWSASRSGEQNVRGPFEESLGQTVAAGMLRAVRQSGGSILNRSIDVQMRTQVFGQLLLVATAEG